jgi:hypothetical protein
MGVCVAVGVQVGVAGGGVFCAGCGVAVTVGFGGTGVQVAV